MKKLLMCFVVSTILCGCIPSEFIQNEQENIINKVEVDDLDLLRDKIIVVITGEDKYSKGLIKYLETSVVIPESMKVYSVDYEADKEKIDAIFSVSKIPTLYLYEKGAVLDKLEYYNASDVEGMAADEEVRFMTKTKKKVDKFIELNSQ